MYIYWFSSESSYANNNNDDADNTRCHSTTTRAKYRQHVSTVMVVTAHIVAGHMVHWAHAYLYLNRFSHICRAHPNTHIDRHKDHATLQQRVVETVSICH